MSGDVPIIRATIRINQLLWRTRGREWDYMFLAEPLSELEGGWYSFHKNVFAALNPREKEAHVIGELFDSTAENLVPFVGAAFLDGRRTDSLGRPIAHYMTWFRQGETIASIRRTVPDGWGRKLLDRMAHALDDDEVFHASTGDESSIRHAFERALAAADLSVDVEGAAVHESDLCSVGVVKKKRSPIRKQLRASESRAARPLDFGAVAARMHASRPDDHSSASRRHRSVAHAIARGEAWALLNDMSRTGKSMPSVGLWFRKQDDEDDLRRLVKSFSGSQDDEFIRARLLGLRTRVINTHTDTLQRGFESVVDALIRSGEHTALASLEEQQGHTLVAEWIAHGASKNDRFVHNVYLRLLGSLQGETEPSSEP
jgi:hypothetical protein